ncbi:MAG: T9SS type A sorting domain-containing protein, partial [Bacteroidales bacterium]|nr:T9SS type A sorting domain-containing protein [Bacteroidales bacterium]
LLLVGDAEQVPSYQAANGASDVSYGYVAGNDHYPDLLVGRFSAESVDQVMLQVDKSINYEKNPLRNNDWLTTSIGIGSDLGPGDDNELDFEHIRNMQNDLLNSTYKNKYELFDGNQGNNDANGNPSKAMVIENINSGAGSILYTGMGNFTKMSTSNFSVSEINKLKNWEMHPFIIAAGCNLGDFVNKTCLAESLMRASHSSKATGTVAALMSSAVQSWFPPMKAQDVMVDILVESSNGNIKRTFGGIAMNGCMAMNDKYGMGAYPVTDTWNIFGDPSLEIRTDNPSIMEASHNDIISVESYGLTIYADVDNGFVAITSGNKILGQAAISNGQAYVLFDQVLETGKIMVVITAFNYIPYFEEINVIAYPTSTQGPVPANHLKMVSPYSSLHWEKGIGGTPDYYRVYLGTDNPPTNMINGVITSDTSIIPEAIFDYNQTYYWKVDAINDHGEAEGDIWEFTAIRPPDETFENSNPSDFGFGSRNFWTFDGDAPWEIDNSISFNGSYSLKSGTIQNQQYSSISFESNNTHEDFVAFGYKVSSEEGKDKLQFLIDGLIMGEWSGEIDWTMESFPIPSGSHKLEWKYIKDELNYDGSDCVWIDDIYLPLNTQILVMAGEDDAICEGNNYVVPGFAQHYSSVNWSTSGTGRFPDKSEVSPLYLPGQEDIEAGEVLLTIYAKNSYSGTCTIDKMTLRFNPLPQINLPSDTLIVPGENIYLDVYDSDIVNYLWLPEEQTTSGIDFYSSDYQIGTHTLKVYVVSSNGCVNHKFINITIENESNEVNNNLSLAVYPNPNNGDIYYNLNATNRDQVRHIIYNQSGALVYESEKIDIKESYSGAIDLTDLPSGIYFMNTIGTETSTSEKIIIQ